MKARATQDRIRKLCSAERDRHALVEDGDGFGWKDASGRGRSRPTAAARDRDLENHIAGKVLEAIGIADWHSYPWHRVADGGAEAIVQDVVSRELAIRQAEAESAPYDAILEAASRSLRR